MQHKVTICFGKQQNRAVQNSSFSEYKSFNNLIYSIFFINDKQIKLKTVMNILKKKSIFCYDTKKLLYQLFVIMIQIAFITWYVDKIKIYSLNQVIHYL